MKTSHITDIMLRHDTVYSHAKLADDYDVHNRDQLARISHCAGPFAGNARRKLTSGKRFHGELITLPDAFKLLSLFGSFSSGTTWGQGRCESLLETVWGYDYLGDTCGW